ATESSFFSASSARMRRASRRSAALVAMAYPPSGREMLRRSSHGVSPAGTKLAIVVALAACGGSAPKAVATSASSGSTGGGAEPERHAVDTAIELGGAVFAPPSSWLLRPATSAAGARLRFHVTTPAGVRFATGVRPAPASTGAAAAADTYEAPTESIDESSF